MEEKEIREIVGQLTLEEKAALCEMIFIKHGDEADVRLGSVPRLGIPGIRNCDNAEGGDYVNFQPADTLHGEHLTCYPQAAALAATWNKDTVERIGQAIGRDARAGDVQLLLRPGVNIKRSPLCGRNFEYYSEDPLLAGELAGAFIRGVQAKGVAACLKHYAVNNHEYDRMTTNAVVRERALREIYLRAFEIAIEKGAPKAIMTSYNKVNGSWAASSHHLIREILREEWDYDGAVLSDGGGIQTNKVEAHKNGLDIELSGPEHTEELLQAVQDGIISEAELNEHCFRALRLAMGAASKALLEADPEVQYAAALRAAEESGILLKNEGALPLRPEERVCVIGALAKEPHYMGGGSGHTNARKLTNAYQEMCNIAGQLPYAAGYLLSGEADETLLEQAKELAGNSERAVVFIGLPEAAEWEGFDRTDLQLPKAQMILLETVCRCCNKITVVVTAGSAVDLSLPLQAADSVFFWYYAGEAMGEAQARLLYGLAEPGGRLPETFPKRIQDTPAFRNLPHWPNPEHDVVYGEGIYVGYRWYDSREIEPQIPFGFGLSYTDFSWSNLTAEPNASRGISVSMILRNTGKRPGWEAVQLYIGTPESAFDRPVRELKGFEKVYLQPGEERRLSFVLTERDLACYSEEQCRWIAEPGTYLISMCRSSRDEVLSAEVHRPYGDRAIRYTPMSSLEQIMKAPGLESALRDFPEEVRKVLLGPQEGMMVLSFGFPIYRQLKNIFGVFSITQEQLQLLLDRLNEETDG